MTADPPRGRDLAAAVVRHVRAFPELHDQAAFMRAANSFGPINVVENPTVDLTLNPERCGTVCCLAGWTVVLGTPPIDRHQVVMGCNVNAESVAQGWTGVAASLLDVPIYDDQRDDWSYTPRFDRLTEIFYNFRSNEHAVQALASMFQLNPDGR